MCSFIFLTTTKDLPSQSQLIHELRGPDGTECISINGRRIIHNLLSLNGSYAPQPVYATRKDAIVFFNGELYNKEIFTSYEGNDTRFLVELIDNSETFGDAIRMLDGEFVICIYSVSDDTISIGTDLFRTKPVALGYSAEEDAWSVSSYSSGADALINPCICEVPGNRLITIDLSSNNIIQNNSLHDFKAIPAETTFHQWTDAFDAAILKRKPQKGKLIIPVSSGFDSGLIAYRSLQLGLDPTFISIPGCEDHEVMLRRQEQLGITFISLSQAEYKSSLEWIYSHVEDYSYVKHQPLLDVRSLHQDPGAVGLYNVLKKGRELGCRVAYSGQGADEIYSDYGFQGKPLANVCSFAGMFPEDIRTILPWKNLFGGTQRSYLMKDEHVAGSLGMESRYPFLDRTLFMCFLALPSSLKNSTYKGPIGRWVSKLNIPVAHGKLGFSANRGLCP